jgi:hypothetical protein
LLLDERLDVTAMAPVEQPGRRTANGAGFGTMPSAMSAPPRSMTYVPLPRMKQYTLGAHGCSSEGDGAHM